MCCGVVWSGCISLLFSQHSFFFFKMTKRKKSGFTKTVAFTRFKQTVLKWWEGNESKYRDQLKSLKHMPFTRFRFGKALCCFVRTSFLQYFIFEDFPHAVPRDDKEAFGRLAYFCTNPVSNVDLLLNYAQVEAAVLPNNCETNKWRGSTKKKADIRELIELDKRYP